MKTCKKCLQEKDESCFETKKQYNKYVRKDGTVKPNYTTTRNTCRVCMNRYYTLAWMKNNRVKYNANMKIYQERASSSLSDVYIKRILTANTPLKNKDIPKELVELHRKQLKLKRDVKIKTLSTTDQSHKLGDELLSKYKKTKDLQTAHLAIRSYMTAVKAVRAQLIYKQLTGKPDKITYIEES